MFNNYFRDQFSNQFRELFDSINSGGQYSQQYSEQYDGGIGFPWQYEDALKLDDVLPNLIADFTNNRYSVNRVSKTFDDIFTFTRSTTGTYVDGSGIIQIAAINEERSDYSTGSRKLLIEDASTNLLFPSNDLTTNWVASNSGTGVFPVINTIDSDALQNIPDASQGSDTGEGYTITGLTYDSDSDTFWTGNIGKATPAASQETPQLVQLSNNGATNVSEINVTGSPQGVAYDTALGVLYYADANGKDVYQINTDGTGEIILFGSITSLNGLAYDSTRGQLWLSDGSDFKRYTTAGALQQTISTAIGNVDQIYYDAEHDWLWITHGASGSQGNVTVIRILDDSVVKTYTFADAYAIEGIVIKDGVLYLANDGYFHQADIADPTDEKNQLQSYPIDFGVIDDDLPDYLKLELGATGSGADNSFLTYTVVSAATRTFSAHFKEAHSGDASEFSTRMDDTTSTEYSDFATTSSWSRYNQTKTTGATTQTVKIILRGDRSTDTIVRVWSQAYDVQDTDVALSHIPTTTLAVTRAKDICQITGTNFTDWYNASTGTFYVEHLTNTVNQSFPVIVSVNDGTSNERMQSYVNQSTGKPATNVRDGGVAQTDTAINEVTDGVQTKVSFAYELNNTNGAANGTLATNDTSVTIPTVTRLELGSDRGGSIISGSISELRYYPIRGLDASIQTLTQ